MTTATDGADTIVLIHGLWMTPLCWERWVEHFGSRGYSVIAPSWPGAETSIEQLRRRPDKLAGVGVSEIVEHYAKIVRELRRPPILIGHSFGGAFVQLLLDRGLGAAGVAIHSAPVRGVFTLRLSTLRTSFPVLRDPRNARRAVSLTPKQFHYAFTNTLSEQESAVVYDRYHVPGPGRVLFEAALANLNPKAPTRVDFGNGRRRPLLLIAGGADHVVPAAVNHENFRRYRSAALTEYREFPGRSHYTLGQEGWQEVADYAIEWVSARAGSG
jgi:alpha-beta hydrolase superfamily lysophospholipase